jgi:predicted phosphohydrolase
MKIIITADIHFEFREARLAMPGFLERLQSEKADVIVAAGDLGVWHAYGECLNALSSVAPKTRLALAGNHDLWISSKRCPSSKDLWHITLPSMARTEGWEWFEDGLKVIENVAIVGSIAWYDYSAAPPGSDSKNLRLVKYQYNNDGNYMDEDWDDLTFASDRRERLERNLQRAQENSAVNRIIVVTHVPVHISQRVAHPEDHPRGNAFFYHYGMGEIIERFPKVTDVVSGHTHRGSDALRPRQGMPRIHYQVVASDYGSPEYVVIDTGNI